MNIDFAAQYMESLLKYKLHAESQNKFQQIEDIGMKFIYSTWPMRKGLKSTFKEIIISVNYGE